MHGSKRNHWYYVDWDQIPFAQLSHHKRRERLFKEAKYACTLCGYDKRREDGGIILEIDHIDGNHQNNAYENLRVLCPNCHALTPNFRNWNGGQRQSTRTYRRKTSQDARVLLREECQKYEEWFKETVMNLFFTKQIDFSRFGWVQKLSIALNDGPQVVGKRIRRLMPDFYAKECFVRTNRMTMITAMNRTTK
jgi:5-methylcytosine-specific restriction endonuclease McrA